MIMETGNYEAALVGDIDEKSFNIVANDKMFKILSSKIYTDKILAPIRELTTNAYDAHVEAGITNETFDVCIPEYTDTKPVFYIRDYGFGLDNKQIEELYTTYGYSSKTKSDEFVGCLGLGSKSPFAYTDKFNLTSIKNGICYKYTCYLDCGVPKVCKFDEFPTKQHSGLKVEFDVEFASIGEFQRKSLDFYFWMEQKPNFVNHAPDFSQYFKQKCDEVYFCCATSLGYENFGVLMGNILYKINYEAWVSYAASHGMKTFNIDKLKCKRIVFSVPIGKFDISVSRESLELTEDNVRKFVNICDEFMAKEKAKAEELLESCETRVEKLTSLISIIKEKPYLNGLHSSEYSEYLLYKDELKEEKEVIFKYYRTGSLSSSSKRTCSVGECKDDKFDFTYYVGKSGLIVVFDEKMKGSASYRAFVNQSPENQFITITNDIQFFEWCKRMGFTVKQKEDFATYKSERMPRNEYFHKIANRGRKPGSVVSVEKIASSEFEDDEVIYYVPIKDNFPIVSPENAKEFELDWISSFEKFLGSQIFGLREKEYLKYKDDERFVNCVDLFLETIQFTDEEKENVMLANSSNMPRNFCELHKNFGLKLEERLMNDEQKKDYEFFLKTLEFEQKNIFEEFTKRELLCYNLKRCSHKMCGFYFERLKTYIYQIYGFASRYLLSYGYTSTQDNQEIVEFVKWKERTELYKRGIIEKDEI